MKTKTCNTCGQEKPLDQFNKDKGKKDGLATLCKECRRKYRKTTKAIVDEYNRNYRVENRARLVQKDRKYYEENKTTLCERSKKRYAQNPEKHRLAAAEYREANPEKSRAIVRKYHSKHKDEAAAYVRERRQTNVNFRLICNCRSRLRHALKGKTKSKRTLELLGCTIEELKQHLETQFKPGMGWDNYGEWQVDHIKPFAKFDLTDESQLQAVTHFSNLQPLWAEENMAKGAK